LPSCLQCLRDSERFAGSYAITALSAIAQAVETASLASSSSGWHGLCDSIRMDTHSDSLTVKKSPAHRRPFYGRRGIGRPAQAAETLPHEEFLPDLGFTSRTSTLPAEQPIETVRWTAADELSTEEEYSCLHFRYRLDCF
jgi:hypothetical protein